MPTKESWYTDRTRILIGDEGIDALAAARVAVYGLGGVGAACAMDLVRAGIGSLYVVDFDKVEISNLNRLYFGYMDTVGESKTAVFERFAKKINPGIEIESRHVFFSGDEAAAIIDEKSCAHADCVDSLNAKVNLLFALCGRQSLFISSMGTAGRLAPERLRVGKIGATSGCPLARSVRTRLRRMGTDLDFPVVWSDEPAVKPVAPAETSSSAKNTEQAHSPAGRRRMTQGSGPFVPQTAGHIMASWIVRKILEGI